MLIRGLPLAISPAIGTFSESPDSALSFGAISSAVGVFSAEKIAFESSWWPDCWARKEFLQGKCLSNCNLSTFRVLKRMFVILDCSCTILEVIGKVCKFSLKSKGGTLRI